MKMAFKDLREFLAVLDEMGQYKELEAQPETGYEVAAIGWELSSRGGGPAIKFNVKGYEIPTVANALGTLERNCVALGLEPKDTFKENFLAIRNRVSEGL